MLHTIRPRLIMRLTPIERNFSYQFLLLLWFLRTLSQFMYIYTIISVYWSFYALRTLYEEKNFNYMNIVIIMFKNIKSLLKTIFIFIALILLGIAMKEILVLFSISLFGFLFVKLNHKAITN